MNISTRQTHDVMRGLTVAYIGIVGSFASILSLLIWAYFQLPKGWGGFALLTALAVSLLLVVCAATFYSVRIRQENRAFRRGQDVLHSINHNYRDVLSDAFGEQRVESDKGRADIEKEVLQSVCAELARLFDAFTHVSCTVSVKLIVRGQDGVLYARKHARSENYCPRDKVEPFDFQLKTGKNTGLDHALRRVQGKITHFFSDDLYRDADDGKYYNERPNWRDCYRSAIVVPIRHTSGKKDDHGWESDNLGFLAVDTMSDNRLNGTYHVSMLAAYADQMYNFMSLMRGKYSLVHDEIKNA
jgi:hypothetical protein